MNCYQHRGGFFGTQKNVLQKRNLGRKKRRIELESCSLWLTGRNLPRWSGIDLPCLWLCWSLVGPTAPLRVWHLYWDLHRKNVPSMGQFIVLVLGKVMEWIQTSTKCGYHNWLYPSQWLFTLIMAILHHLHNCNDQMTILTFFCLSFSCYLFFSKLQ